MSENPNNSNELRIGIIGLDTSHVTAFTSLLNDQTHEYHVPGGKVTVAYPGGSPDFPLSISRVEGFTNDLQSKYGVKIVTTPEEVAAESDAILLESADGRVHLEQFRKIASYRKPVFIDKPLALKSSEAKEIILIAQEYQVPIMSSSSMRYAESLRLELERGTDNISGADVYGPMSIEETQSYYFWYGIHTAEMLLAIMGTGVQEVTAASTDEYELITGRWKDGRIGTLRGNRSGNNTFGALVHRHDRVAHVEVNASTKPYYASLLEQVMVMFQTGKSVLDYNVTLEVIRFLEAAEQSREQGTPISL